MSIPPLSTPLPARMALVPPVARLSLQPTRSRQRMLDGAWWPHSYDAEIELPALAAALIAGSVAVTRIALKRGAWESAPQTVDVDGHVVRLYWHGPQDIHAISVTADGQRRLDILVVPPEATTADARPATWTGRDETTSLRPDQAAACRTLSLAPGSATSDVLWRRAGDYRTDRH